MESGPGIIGPQPLFATEEECSASAGSRLGLGVQRRRPAVVRSHPVSVASRPTPWRHQHRCQ